MSRVWRIAPDKLAHERVQEAARKEMRSVANMLKSARSQISRRRHQAADRRVLKRFDPAHREVRGVNSKSAVFS
jgi:hypothetical protein